MIQNSVEASRNASLRLPCWSRSVNTGTNAADSAALANRLATRLGTWKAIVNAGRGPAGAEEARGDDFAREAHDARDAGRDREDRRVARDPFSSASLPPSPGPGSGRVMPPYSSPKLPSGMPMTSPERSGRGPPGGSSAPESGQGRYSTALHGARRRSLPGSVPQQLMANIHSQKKRILRSERERLENRRYTSAIKTYFRRLEAAVQSGDAPAAEAEHRACSARSTRPSSAVPCTATRAPTRSPAPHAPARRPLTRAQAAIVIALDRSQRERDPSLAAPSARRSAPSGQRQHGAAARVELELGQHAQRPAQALGVGAGDLGQRAARPRAPACAGRA